MPNIKSQATGVASTGAVPSGRRINTTTPLQGGGDLSQDRTLSIDTSDFGSGTVTHVYPGSNIDASPEPITASGSVGLANPLSGPLWIGSIADANRIVTSGELAAGGGTGTVTNLVPGSNLAMVPSPITVTGTIGLAALVVIPGAGGLQVSGGFSTYDALRTYGSTQDRLVIGDSASNYFAAVWGAPNPGGTFYQIQGSGLLTGSLQFQALTPNDVAFFNGLPIVTETNTPATLRGSLAVSGGLSTYGPVRFRGGDATDRIIIGDPATSTTQILRATPNAGGVWWTLTGSGVVQGRVNFTQQTPQDEVSVDAPMRFLAGASLSARDVQVSGTLLGYRPFYQGRVADAQRYVTSGEVGAAVAGAGTITTLVPGANLAMAPNPITVTGTIGLTDTVVIPAAGSVQVSGGLSTYGPVRMRGFGVTDRIIIGDPTGSTTQVLRAAPNASGEYWSLTGSGSITGAAEWGQQFGGDRLSFKTLPVEFTTGATLTTLDVQASGLIIAYGPVVHTGDVQASGALHTYGSIEDSVLVGDGSTTRFIIFRGRPSTFGYAWDIRGSGSISGQVEFQQQTPQDAVRFEGTPVRLTQGATLTALDTQVSGLLIAYQPVYQGQITTAQRYVTSGELDGFVVADGRPTGQSIFGGVAAAENLALQSTSHATKGLLTLANKTQWQADGTVINLGPAYADGGAERYVTSGELTAGGGTGTVTTLVPGANLAMVPSPITVTGTIGLTNPLTGPLWIGAATNAQRLVVSGELGAFAVLNGNAFSQVLNGGTQAGGELYLRSTSNATKGMVSLGTYLEVFESAGRLTAYGPIYAGSVAAARRYVTSGELAAGGGTGTVTTLVPGSNLAMVPSPITVTGTIGLTNPLTGPLWIGAVTNAQRLVTSGELASLATSLVPGSNIALAPNPLTTSGSIGLTNPLTGPLWIGAVASANRLVTSGELSAAGGSGTVTNLVPGSNIAMAPNPITVTGTIGLTNPLTGPLWVTSAVNAQRLVTSGELSAFAALEGRSAGQTLKGGTGAVENLRLQSTAHATRGSIYLDNSVEVTTAKVLTTVPVEATSGLLTLDFQASGTLLAYAPSYQGRVASAQRYVTSGELSAGGGTGTVTTLVPGSNLAMVPSPITVTGTIGLSDVVVIPGVGSVQVSGSLSTYGTVRMRGTSGDRIIIGDPTTANTQVLRAVPNAAGEWWSVTGSGSITGALTITQQTAQDAVVVKTTPVRFTQGATLSALDVQVSGTLRTYGTARFAQAGGTTLNADGSVTAATGLYLTSGQLQVVDATLLRGFIANTGPLSDGVCWQLLGSGLAYGSVRFLRAEAGDLVTSEVPFYGSATVANATRYTTSGELDAFVALNGRSGGQTIIGGTGSGDDLTLQSTSHATKGTLFLDDTLELWPSHPTTGTFNLLQYTRTFSNTGVTGIDVFDIAPTITYANGLTYRVINAGGTFNRSTGSAFQLFQLFACNQTEITTGNINPWGMVALSDNSISEHRGTGSSEQTMVQNVKDVRHNAATGTYTVPNLVGFKDVPSIEALTAGGTMAVTERAAVWVRDPGFTATGTVTLARNVGLSVDALSVGTVGNRTVTLAAAVYSNVASGTNRWCLYSTGTAASAHAGNMTLGSTTAPATPLDVYGADNATAVTVRINATQANITAADTFVDFRSTTGSEGTIQGTAVAGVIAYNTFTGSHYTQVIDREGLQPNMLLEIVDGTPELKAPKAHLFCTRVARTRASARAVGVYGGTDREGRDLLLALGTGFIWVTNTGADIALGDYLMASAVAGHAERQPDDLYHNYTVAKATQAVYWEAGEAARLISCIYLGG